MPRADVRLRAFLDAPSLVRWIYRGRLLGVAVILVAAARSWSDVTAVTRQVAPLLVAGALVFTGASILWSEIYRKPLRATFLYGQVLFDLVLVTAVVHLTGGGVSQYAALYILTIAAASLLLPTSGGLIVALFGCALYFGDVLLTTELPLGAGVWLQLLVFATVAVGSGLIAVRLRVADAGTQELAAELVKVRLSSADILRNLRSGIVTVDADGQLLYANPAASTLLGVNLEGEIGRPVIPAIRRVAPELATAMERAAREGTRTARAEGSILAGERTFPIGLQTTYSDGDGQPDASSATAIFQDISDQKRLDTLHLRAQRLEAVAELSASLAHEIKNPLASIRSAVEQLSRSPRADEDEQVLAGLIVRESDRLSRLLSEFLDFSRVRVAKVERVDLAAVAQGAASLAAAHPDRAAGVTVECAPPDAPALVEGDEDLLHRAVFNLVLNAVQASPPNGRVRVAIEPIAADVVPSGMRFDAGGAAVRVSDEGPGIPADIRDRLFDPFFTTKPGGSGLGLSVVHRAIEAHRGFTLVDSDGTGTRMTILLPSTQSENGERA